MSWRWKMNRSISTRGHLGHSFSQLNLGDNNSFQPVRSYQSSNRNFPDRTIFHNIYIYCIYNIDTVRFRLHCSITTSFCHDFAYIRFLLSLLWWYLFIRNENIRKGQALNKSVCVWQEVSDLAFDSNEQQWSCPLHEGAVQTRSNSVTHLHARKMVHIWCTSFSLHIITVIYNNLQYCQR